MFVLLIFLPLSITVRILHQSPQSNHFWHSLDARFVSYKGRTRIYFIVTIILSLSERKKKHFKWPEKKQSILGEDTLD